VRFSDGEVQCRWHSSRRCTGENRDWATGFEGRNMPPWSRRLIALGRKPAPLRTYRVEFEGDDVFVHL
jgi:nitrite reductase/ring-hydroxylating ferredoxin subunit